MIMAIKCFRFGCRLPPAKLESLFGVVAFSEGVDHLAVPLSISLLLDCQSSMLLRACARNLSNISTISRALLLQGMPLLGSAIPPALLLTFAAPFLGADVFCCITHDIRTRRRELRSLVYTLTPPLQVLVSTAEQLTTLSNRRISHLHDLIAFIDLEVSIAGHPLPSDLRSLVSKLQVIQPSTVPITGLLTAIQIAATPDVLASVIAGGVGNHPELKQLLDRFDLFFDEGKRNDLVAQLVQLFCSRATGDIERVHGPLDHRACLGHANPREKCPLWSPLRTLLVWYLVDRRIKGSVHDGRGTMCALDFISASFQQLGDRWCLSELDSLWGQLSLFLILLHGHSQQSRMVARSVFDVASLCAHHSSWLDNDLFFPDQGAVLPLSVPRLVFPSAVVQLEQLLGFKFGRNQLSLQTWSEHALAFLALNNRGSSSVHRELGMQDMLNDGAHNQNLTDSTSLCRSIFAFLAACYHVDAALRLFLEHHFRDLEWHLEKNHLTLVQDWREQFVNQVGHCMSIPF
ncbi:hypothetical protein BCR44DRAFT_39956 [Catenaria anguillulae PL171]|uniref:Uncharacterized protein n=1 Tax=Catenaria anguillulae PL171 TaxID=765915 RepID=A0A1Y2HXZ2_9FUNG|nr:hypothetical protein BCR44DRAFT_39956 [Catenaria anguillulae PL171]